MEVDKCAAAGSRLAQLLRFAQALRIQRDDLLLAFVLEAHNLASQVRDGIGLAGQRLCAFSSVLI